MAAGLSRVPVSSDFMMQLWRWLDTQDAPE